MDLQIDLKKTYYYQLKYSLKCWLFLPITFLKRIVFGKDKLAKRYFFDRWGFLPKRLKKLAHARNTIWISANSGGEVNQAVNLFKKLKTIFPKYNIIISTESYDTFQYAQILEGVDFVFFPPWDIGSVCKRFLKILKPSILIFIEHCYFPILSKKAKKLDIITLMCSAMINPQLLHGYFLMQRAFALRFYNFIDKFGVKSKEDFNNLCDLGVNQNKILILGDMKFDFERFLLDNDYKEKFRKDLNLSSTDLVFLVGSIHAGEVDLVLNAFYIVRKSFPKLKLILAPRWKKDIQFIETKIREYGYIFLLRSHTYSTISNKYDILIIDTFGELARLYGIASVVFLASTIIPINVRRLGHNIFEPLAHGVPVLFGPYMGLWKKFTEPLKEVWPECEVHDSKTLSETTCKVLSNEEIRKKLKDCSLRLTRNYYGIAQKYVEFIQPEL